MAPASHRALLFTRDTPPPGVPSYPTFLRLSLSAERPTILSWIAVLDDVAVAGGWRTTFVDNLLPHRAHYLNNILSLLCHQCMLPNS